MNQDLHPQTVNPSSQCTSVENYGAWLTTLKYQDKWFAAFLALQSRDYHRYLRLCWVGFTSQPGLSIKHQSVSIRHIRSDILLNYLFGHAATLAESVLSNELTALYVVPNSHLGDLPESIRQSA